MSHDNNLSMETIKEFTAAAHSDLNRVKELCEQYPELLSTHVNEWEESALTAAAHTGNREIAEYLLAKGAELDICTAAMLGKREAVAQFLEQDPSQAKASGAHGIPIIYHAALSGDTIIADMLMTAGGGVGLEESLHGATRFGHLEMTQWFLERNADTTIRDFRDRTPLEVAIENGYDEVAEVLREHIGRENLAECPECGAAGWQYVSRIEGNRWAEHTTYYECKQCHKEMSSRHSAGR